MEYGLTLIAAILGIAVAGTVIFALLRHGIRSWNRRRLSILRKACLEILSEVEALNEDGVDLLAAKIKIAFDVNLAGGLIVEMMAEARYAPHRSKLANLYDALGLIEHLNKELRESKSWVARAEAAQNLGVIGHPRAVLPLISTLQDKTEMAEVKNVVMRSLAALNDTRAIAPLIEALGSADPSTGQPIADTLSHFGREAVGPLMEALHNSAQESQRYWTVKALLRLKAQESVGALIGALKDRSERVREAAAQALGELKAPDSIYSLKEMLLNDPVPFVREKAAAALGAIGDDYAMEALKRGLADMEYGARLKAMEALESMGAKAVPVFLAALTEADERMMAQAASALERMGIVGETLESLAGGGHDRAQGEAFQLLVRIAKAGSIQTLARYLQHPNAGIRTWVCRVLRASKCLIAREALVDAVYKDTEWTVRLQAAHALAVLHQAQSLPAIVHVLKQTGEGRGALLMDLTGFPQEALKEAVADLALLSKDMDRDTRLAAVTLLGSVESLDSISPLLAAFKDGTVEVRSEAARSAARHAAHLEAAPDLRRRALDGLLEMLVQDTHVRARVAAAGGLGAFRDPETIVPLAKSFIYADESYRDDIVRALVQIDHEEIIRRVDDLLKLDHPKARAGVAWTLGMAGDSEEIVHLSVFLADPDPSVRSAAAGGLGCLGLAQAAPILAAHLSDPNERVRASVVNALAKCGAPETVEKLLPMLKDPDSFVAARAALSIGVLGSKIPEPKELRSKLKAWKEKTEDAFCRSSALAALVLMQEKTAFKECMALLADPAQAVHLRKHIAALSPGMQKKFFSLISLDPHMLFETEPKLEQMAQHYAQMLHGSRLSQERIRAVEMIALMSLPDAAGQLQKAFNTDPEPMVRMMAFTAISKMLRGKELTKTVAAAVKDPHESVRNEAVSVLKKLSPSELGEAKEHLIPLLDSAPAGLREAVCGLLVKAYEKNPAALARSLEETKNKNRILGLLLTLGAIGEAETVTLFMKWIQHTDADIRATALEAGSLRGLLSAQDLMPCLEDPQEMVRVAAMRGLANQWDSTHLEAILTRLQDPSYRVRQALASALGKLDTSGDERPRDGLRKLLGDHHPEVKAQSLISLLRLGDEEMGPAVAKIMAEMEKSKKEDLISKLDSDGMISKFTAALKNSPAAAKRKQALELLASLDLKRFTDAILAALQDPSAEVRVAAVTALGPLKDPKIKEAVDALSYDPVEAVRTAVKWSRLNLP